MKKRLYCRRIAIAVGIFTLALLARGAAGASPKPALPPKPDFSSFMFYTGTWTCWQMVGGKPQTHVAVAALSPDGMWMIERDTQRIEDADVTVAGTRYLTYDATIARWVEVGVNSVGGYWLGSSPGWQGATIVFTTNGLDGSTQTDAITKDNDIRRHDNYSGVDGKGRAYQGTSHCNKLKG